MRALAASVAVWSAGFVMIFLRSFSVWNACFSDDFCSVPFRRIAMVSFLCLSSIKSGEVVRVVGPWLCGLPF